jgi:uncharacterized cupredoxin-like copper-binding protein
VAHGRAARVARALPAGLVVAAAMIPPAGWAEPPRTVRIEMTEFAFRPAVVSLAAGRPVRLVFVNRGQLAHQFQADYFRSVPVRVVDESTLVEAPGATVVRLEPGTSASMEFYPRRTGRFAFACTIEGHREAGMRGVLEIK